MNFNFVFLNNDFEKKGGHWQGGALVFEVGYHPRKKNSCNKGCFSGPGNVRAYIV